MEEKDVYIVGRIDEIGGFHVWSADGVTNNFERSEKVLLDAINNCPAGLEYHVYKVKPRDLHMIDVDKGLTDYNRFLEVAPLNNFKCIVDGKKDFVDVHCYSKEKYTKKTKTITVSYYHDYVYLSSQLYTDEERNAIRDEVDERIENFVKYAVLPSVKKILKEHNMDVRVEFKNHYTGRKIIKGFITKE